MNIRRNALVLRKGEAVHTRLALRDERNVSYLLKPVIAPIYLSFCLVDWMAAGYHDLGLYFLIRLSAICSSWILYALLRGRVRYGVRFFCLLAPYIYAIQFIMIRNDLGLGPYFAGVTLVLFSGTIMFPLNLRVSIFVYLASMAPSLLYFGFNFLNQGHSSIALMALAMSLGAVILSAANSVGARKEVEGRIAASEALSHDLRNRKKEIAEKAQELVKLKRLESQFSPDMAKAIVDSPTLLKSMVPSRLVLLVADVQSSTKKAATLPPERYKEVIEEVFDAISNACLQNGITIDKFTGDGAQAFAGFPKHNSNDIGRAIVAALAILSRIEDRNSFLRGLWGEPVGIRIAVVEGPALVGMLGAGSLKSFTAIGEAVSFTHRLCGVAAPNTVQFFSFINNNLMSAVGVGDFTAKPMNVTGLKGFEERSFRTISIIPQAEVSEMQSTCPTCGSKLVFESDTLGFPRVSCPSCSRAKAA